METIEKFWHIDKDMELMDKTFTVQSDYANKKYNDDIQETNDRQNKALNLIALFQIIGFISIVSDSVEFHNKAPLIALGSFSVISLFLILVMKRYFSSNKNK